MSQYLNAALETCITNRLLPIVLRQVRSSCIGFISIDCDQESVPRLVLSLNLRYLKFIGWLLLT